LNSTALYILEDFYYPKSEILSFLGLDDNGGSSFNFLIENRYLRKNKEGKYAFKYVGLIAIQDKVLLVFPKYYCRALLENDDPEIRSNNYADFIQVLRVLKQLSKSNDINEDFNLVTEEKSENELIIADEIFKDYFIHGNYNKEEGIIELNGDGEIDWDKTVNGIQPFFSKGRPIYNDTFTSELLTDHDNIISQIHKWAVKYCLNKYSDFLDYQIVFDADSATELDEIGELDFLLSKINSELREVFVDRKIRLMHLLSSLLRKQFNQKYSNNLNMYGTDTFWSVWEKTCSKVFDNKKDKEPFEGTIPKPEWNSLVFNDREPLYKDTLIPDIIYGMKEERVFFVIDAKYYSIAFEKDQDNVLKLSGNPGIADVTKQLLYEYAFMEGFGSDYDSWYNILAFPTPITTHDNKSINVFGSTKLDLGIFSDKNICLVYLNPKIIFSNFLLGNIDSQISLKSILNDNKITPNKI
jgi:hypothetical protein